MPKKDKWIFINLPVLNSPQELGDQLARMQGEIYALMSMFTRVCAVIDALAYRDNREDLAITLHEKWEETMAALRQPLQVRDPADKDGK